MAGAILRRRLRLSLGQDMGTLYGHGGEWAWERETAVDLEMEGIEEHRLARMDWIIIFSRSRLVWSALCGLLKWPILYLLSLLGEIRSFPWIYSRTYLSVSARTEFSRSCDDLI